MKLFATFVLQMLTDDTHSIRALCRFICKLLLNLAVWYECICSHTHHTRHTFHTLHTIIFKTESILWSEYDTMNQITNIWLNVSFHNITFPLDSLHISFCSWNLLLLQLGQRDYRSMLNLDKELQKPWLLYYVPAYWF